MQVPSSTYRVQLHDKFTLADLGRQIDYLHRLGISTIYASPLTTAFKGSTHGYDVTNPLFLNPEIGTEQELEQLAARLKSYGMTWLQDIVPNHMAYDSSNPWLYDVLERGKNSLYYGFFDINTDHPIAELGDQLMTPFLGASLKECLAKEELQLQFDVEQGFRIAYYDKTYPVAASLYKWICSADEGCPPALLDGLHTLEKAIGLSPQEWKQAKESWLAVVTEDPARKAFIESRPAFFNQRSHLLETLLESGPYLLTAASLAAGRINYRRFFTVNSLICLRMEKPEVQEAYHARIIEWHQKGWIQGLRVDHIDGLAEPKKYHRWLKETLGNDTYVVAEKILTRDEVLTEDWALEGTTGYDFLSWTSQLLTDANGSKRLLDFYQKNVFGADYTDVVYQRKLSYLLDQMGGELDNLVDQLKLIAGIDFNKQALWREALGVWMASFPIYRVYPENGRLPVEDQVFIQQAQEEAQRRRPDLKEIIGTITALFGAEDEDQLRIAFVSRLMQFTGPLAAKGIEDTSFYVYNPYISHNEVGDSPATAGITPETFHQKIKSRQAWFPYSMNGSTTHDTKRGEDARIRLNLLSAHPQQWIDAVGRWKEINASYITYKDNRRAPSPNDEYLIYQALMGSYPEDGHPTSEYRERFAGYWTKALREAKEETHYDQPDQWYEEACQTFIAQLLKDDSPFLADFVPAVLPWINESFTYSLSQLLIKLTTPGVPDIYQGAELWETSLVDPDNRRAVDYAKRQELLQAVIDGGWVAAQTYRQQGAEKLFVLYHTLHYRNQHPSLFSDGEYIPLYIDGPFLAFMRHKDEDWALVVAPLIDGQRSLPKSTTLSLPEDAPAHWSHCFTDEWLEATGTEPLPAQKTAAGATVALPTRFRLTIRMDQIPVVLLTAKTGQ